jgi:hypothetical protein
MTFLEFSTILAGFGKQESGCVCGLFVGLNIALQYCPNLNINPQTTRNLVVWQTRKQPANRLEFRPHDRRNKHDANSTRAARKRGGSSMSQAPPRHRGLGFYWGPARDQWFIGVPRPVAYSPSRVKEGASVASYDAFANLQPPRNVCL